MHCFVLLNTYVKDCGCYMMVKLVVSKFLKTDSFLAVLIEMLKQHNVPEVIVLFLQRPDVCGVMKYILD